jgi:polar amino acid transport system substrate-binding protein
MKRRQVHTALVVALSTGFIFLPTVFENKVVTQAQDEKQLVMGTSPDYPPYEFYDTAGGKQDIVGFDIDIAKRIATELGFELKIEGMDFNGLLPAMQSGRLDFVMAGMTPTEERKKNADFSVIYFNAQNTILSKKGNGFSTLADLNGKKVGVQLGTIQETAVKDHNKKNGSIEAVSLNKISDIILEIKAGRIQAGVVEDTVAQGFIEKNPDLEFAIIQTDGPSGSAVAFPKGSEWVEPFNQVIEKMKENGEIDTLAEKWFTQTISQ